MNVPCKGTATHMVEIIYMHVHSNLQVVLKYAFFHKVEQKDIYRLPVILVTMDLLYPSKIEKQSTLYIQLLCSFCGKNNLAY